MESVHLGPRISGTELMWWQVLQMSQSISLSAACQSAILPASELVI